MRACSNKPHVPPMCVLVVTRVTTSVTTSSNALLPTLIVQYFRMFLWRRCNIVRWCFKDAAHMSWVAFFVAQRGFQGAVRSIEKTGLSPLGATSTKHSQQPLEGILRLVCRLVPLGIVAQRSLLALASFTKELSSEWRQTPFVPWRFSLQRSF